MIVGVVMVAGWPIAHHVWAGNRIDHSTVQEVISDLRKRFEFGRLVFVGDRGMVTDENIESITKDKHGFLVGIKRRRNAQLDGLARRRRRDEVDRLSRRHQYPGTEDRPAAHPCPGSPLRRSRACG